MEGEGISLIERIEKIKAVHRVLILVATLVIMSALFLWVIYLPKTREIKGLEKHIASLGLKLRRAKIHAKNLGKLEAEYKDVNQQFEEALKLLPNKREIPSLLTAITQLGTKSHLDFLLFKPNKERKKDFYAEIPVSVKVRGTFRDIVAFFARVGQMERIVNILDVSMAPAKALSTTLITSCNAITYRFKETGNKNAGSRKKKK